VTVARLCRCEGDVRRRRKVVERRGRTPVRVGRGGINTRLIEYSTGEERNGSVSESEMKRETGQSLPGEEKEKEKEHHAVGREREV
jgi:hypothetical protein